MNWTVFWMFQIPQNNMKKSTPYIKLKTEIYKHVQRKQNYIFSHKETTPENDLKKNSEKNKWIIWIMKKKIIEGDGIVSLQKEENLKKRNIVR